MIDLIDQLALCLLGLLLSFYFFWFREDPHSFKLFLEWLARIFRQ